ncbi:MAG: bacterial transcriptional activator domain-containing protein [Caldilineaceae bacterium]|nr:bacterial transcriptional activator domain-containing protein [Caldilineaceae bacterium]
MSSNAFGTLHLSSSPYSTFVRLPTGGDTRADDTALPQPRSVLVLYEERRSYATAITHAQRLLHYDLLHEATYRHLMRLCALAGDRAGALRVYHTCVAAQERELDAPPSSAASRTYRLRIQRGVWVARYAKLVGHACCVTDTHCPFATGVRNRIAHGRRAVFRTRRGTCQLSGCKPDLLKQ